MVRLFTIQRREFSGPFLGVLLLALIFLSVLGAAGMWHFRMGSIALSLGILMLLAPPVIRLGKPVILLSIGFLLFGLAPFLPVDIFGVPEWRKELSELGVETGDLVTIQWKQALESHLSFVLLFFSGLWLLGQRFSTRATRNLVVTFVIGVASYAILSEIFDEQIPVGRETSFGFFPNQNHSSNLLSLGFLCGLGALFQSLRNKRPLSAVILLMASGLILWAVFSWNTSRSGIVLCLSGAVIWLCLLGKRYFGRQELKALGLVALLVGGVYAISEFRVKDRITTTVEKISGDDDLTNVSDSLADSLSERAVRLKEVDLRGPIAIDTVQMIAAAPLTGVGAGQFRWVYPQYRKETLVQPNLAALHPESSWLWLAAELGLPATACILALVALLFLKGLANIKRQRHRDRALRLGCLVAAALVPLHGLFDVPAHRPSLFLAALFLFVLSQNHEERESAPNRGSRWPSFVLAISLVVVGVRLLGTSWFGWSPPHLVKSEKRLAEGVALYHQATDLQNPLPPFEALSLREEASKMAETAAKEAPLDGRFYRLSALTSLPLEFKTEMTGRHFEIDRRLSPYSVRIPLLQSSSALFYNLVEVKKGWRAAIERAKAVDEVKGKGPLEVERVLKVITNSAARNPQLKSLADQIMEDAK
nr:O-antigen ligase family protein [bacterium]